MLCKGQTKAHMSFVSTYGWIWSPTLPKPMSRNELGFVVICDDSLMQPMIATHCLRARTKRVEPLYKGM
ncbi:Uncharacterized protein TCM_015819 [Theobroma cacao]|uniref:Uncharacterized protein n=1 Tax=Theobroma cacao TaxID=3641 RepID=A0A061G3K8_THECC|nr:Uncharacterized protein TCM_015819 [Theobroma cacao]